MSQTGWIGVDLDGTLAHYDGGVGVDHIGPPVPAMLTRVKQWLAEGRAVKIFTARVHGHGTPLIGGGTEDAITPIAIVNITRPGADPQGFGMSAQRGWLSA